MRFIFLIVILIFECRFPLKAQIQGDFVFGTMDPHDFNMMQYEKDSSANAVILQEFGSAEIRYKVGSYIDFYHHIKIKILNKNGFDKANVIIPLRKSQTTEETFLDLKASTFNLKEGKVKETQYNSNVFIKEAISVYYDLVKFTLSDIQEGSIIEYSYRTTSPYIYNFHKWSFQSDIPKIKSEYRTLIPHTYQYNVALKGYLPFHNQESFNRPECITIGRKVNCIENHYSMIDIPAFYEEDYMTSKNNFIAALEFELRTIVHYDNTRDEITKNWKDADQELKEAENFGKQIKKERSAFWKERLTPRIAAERDTLKKAVLIEEFIKDNFRWNGYYGKYTTKSIKKSFSDGEGNVADINLALISALRYAGIDADPVILSTRNNGIVTKLFPVISQFDYVIARCVIKGEAYFLDATERALEFGVLPPRCLNGEGRIISSKFKSEWIDIPYQKNNKTVITANLVFQPEGNYSGNIVYGYSGYENFIKKSKIGEYNSIEEYIATINKNNFVDVTNYGISNLKEREKNLQVSLQFKKEDSEIEIDESVFINPFFDNQIKVNPFKSPERLYPVDFAYPWETVFSSYIEVPDNFEIVSIPEKVALKLPDNGGKYIYNSENKGNKICISVVLSFSKSLYSSSEYHNLKELYDIIVKSQSEEIILKRMK